MLRRSPRVSRSAGTLRPRGERALPHTLKRQEPGGPRTNPATLHGSFGIRSTGARASIHAFGAAMAQGDKRIVRQVVNTLVHDDRVEPVRAEEAVARAMARLPTQPGDALEIYRAARRVLDRGDSVPPQSGELLHSPVKPARAPPPRRGTRRDTPVAKKSR